MNSPETQQPSSLNLEFNVLAGALAGFVIAVEVNLLELLVWGIGLYADKDFNMSMEELVWLSPQGIAVAVLCLPAAGVIVGLLATILLRIAPAIRPMATQSAFSLWVLGPFIYAIFGGVRVPLAVHLVLIDALLAFVMAVIAYAAWCELLRWLRQGQVWSVVVAVATMSAILWLPLAIYAGSS